jgi:hypothetical protein
MVRIHHVELLITKELYPAAKPGIIHDNGKQDVSTCYFLVKMSAKCGFSLSI